MTQNTTVPANSTPLVSVVLPTYKRPHLIISAINSVNGQTYTNWEMIIVDDNGKDSSWAKDTAEKVNSFNSTNNIVYFQQPQNMGACAARNKGIELANGTFIAFLDDDDIWNQDKLEKQIKGLLQSKADVCYCDMYLEYKNVRRYFAHRITQEPYKALLNRGFGICTSALVVSKSALEHIKGFDNSLPSMQDYDLLIRLSEHHRLCEIQEPLLTYAMDDDGISMNMNSKIGGHQAIIRKYREIYLKLGLAKALSRQLECLADFKILSGRRLSALTHYIEALKLTKKNARVWFKLLAGSILGGVPLKYLAKRRTRNTATTIAE